MTRPIFLDDLRAVVWKEWRELADQFDTRSRANLVIIAIVVAQFCIVTPIFVGREWLTSASLLVTFPLLGSTIAVQPVIDAFAGERERHTLETLLASRLRDRAILAGKMLAAWVPASAVALAMFALGVAAVNVAHPAGGPMLPPAWLTLAVVLMTLLFPGFTIAAGVFVSLRAPTVRQAAQNFGYIFIAVLVAPFLISVLIPDAWRGAALGWLRTVGPMRVVVIAALLMAIVDAAFVLLAARRFRRGQLTLD